MKQVFLFPAASLLLLAGLPLCAQQSPPQPETKPQQKIPTVTTTIVVNGGSANGYVPELLSLGNLDGQSLKETPVSALVITRSLLDDQQSRLLSDIVKNDASIGEDYAPVGYYGDYQIRGIPIDLATGLEINGLSIAGEQDVPLENKDRVEFLKGLGALESGVASSGGLINFATKRAAPIHAIDLATDQRGSAYAATDIGWLFGHRKQFGLRTNLAGERIATYVNGANGWRALASGAFDFKLSPDAIWTNDFEYQHKVQRSVGGYQLLGGTVVPSLSLISPSTLLGLQAWSKPNTFDVFNTGTRVEFALAHNWRARIAAGYSHSLIDDNVVYAYGCGYQDVCNTGSPAWFFAPDGSYDIYDYRDPNELRTDLKFEALITGTLHTGAITHHITTGAELFTRTVKQPGYYTATNPSTDTITDGAVYTYVGTENIYSPVAAFPIESPHQSAGPQRLWLNDHTAALIAQDRIELPHHIQLIAGGRIESLRDHNYSLAATTPGLAPTNSEQSIWMPRYAITWSPRADLTLYGNYGLMLSLGPQAPWWVDNGSQFLAPFRTRQAEAGAKFTHGDNLLLTAALFRMRTPFFYPRIVPGPDNFCPTAANGDICFESDGHETHQGLELSAEGKAANSLRFSGSLSWSRAISSNSSTPAYNNKEIINQPHLRATIFADYAVPHLRSFHLMPGFSYTGTKAATRDDAVSVPGYNLFNLGARYSPGGENGKLSFRIYADNITDRRYWKDTGANYGDTFLHLGAPTTVRLSAHYTF